MSDFEDILTRIETQLTKSVKRFNISMNVIIITFIILVLILYFYNPRPDQSLVVEQNQAKEELRQSDMKLVNAKLDSIKLMQQRTEDFAREKDIELTQRLQKNIDDLKIIQNEKRHNYDTLTSLQLQHEVADLVRQYKAVQR